VSRLNLELQAVQTLCTMAGYNGPLKTRTESSAIESKNTDSLVERHFCELVRLL
jgi:hypothetical protein